jgi:hypothetical protein
VAITTQDGLVSALAAFAPTPWQKASIANTVAGQMHSLWRATGSPNQAAIPAAFATCTDALLGAFPFTNPVGPALSYLATLSCQMANSGSLIVYDRLAHMGGLSGTSIVAQNVLVTIPASRGALDTGEGSEWFLEWYTDTGATAVNATVSYTDQTNTAGRTVVVALGTTMRASRLLPIPPNAGQSIKSIQTVTLSASTLTVGSFGVTVARRLASVPVGTTNLTTPLGVFDIGLPRLYDDGCLWLVNLVSTTTTGFMQGTLQLIQG